MAYRAKEESKLKEITEWDDFCALLACIEESADVEEFLGSDDEDEEMDCENIADVDSCGKDDSEDTCSEDDSSCARLHSLPD